MKMERWKVQKELGKCSFYQLHHPLHQTPRSLQFGLKSNICNDEYQNRLHDGRPPRSLLLSSQRRML